MNFISTGDISEDFHQQTGDIYHQPATSSVCKVLYFVARVGLLGCALIFLGKVRARVSFWLYVNR